MRTGIIGTSYKENEKRVAIHPEHLTRIAPALRGRLVFERGYGLPFGKSDEILETLTGNELLPRDEILKTCDAVVIPKPIAADFSAMRDGMTVWGWIHSVQQQEVAQIAIEKKLTLVAFENMNHQTRRGRVHIFQKNNELAGYCGVQHALTLRGIDGFYGPRRKAVVLSFGSVSRGAIRALQGHGIYDIDVLTRRASHLVGNQAPGCRFLRFYPGQDGRLMVAEDEKAIPLIDLLTRADIVVNGILQSPSAPVTFVSEEEVARFERECLIVDVSCDAGMGFPCARPASFTEPLIQIGKLLYYSVDHTPSLLWDSASWEISAALLPYLSDFLTGQKNPVLEAAYDMRNGAIVNHEIVHVQHREASYPYRVLKKAQVKRTHRRGTVPRHILTDNAGLPTVN